MWNKLRIFFNNLLNFQNLQAVTGGNKSASSGKFYRLPPDMENPDILHKGKKKVTGFKNFNLQKLKPQHVQVVAVQ